MKVLSSLVAITLLGTASIAGAQIKMPNAGAPGGSFDSAVRLLTTSELMLERQIKGWLRKHYPGWDQEPHELQNFGGEKYAIVYITSPNNPGRRVYFRLLQRPGEDETDSGATF
jgi:hypothetical protein